MVSKFVQRAILGHLVFVGVGYLIVRIFGDYIWPDEAAEIPVHPMLIFLVTLIGAICYGHWVRKYRPVPHNPIQQFQINCLIAAYSIVVGLSIALTLAASGIHPLFGPAWPLVTLVCVYLGCGLLYRVDHPVAKDPPGREMTPWQLIVFETKKYRTRY